MLFSIVSSAAVFPVAAQPGVLQVSSQGQCFGYNGVDDSAIPRIVTSLRIVLVQPILTATPYSQYATGSFYAFYAKEKGVTGNITTNLDLLSTGISSGFAFNGGWGLSYGFYRFLTSQTARNCGLVIGANVQILDDLNVSQGGLFGAGSQAPRFDVVILPFTEYVTSEEYSAYENFVAAGGTLIQMAHALEYPVTYNATTHKETLVYGHGFAFNGKYAYPIPCRSETYIYTCPWAKNNTNWAGSNTCMSSCFHTYKFNGSTVNPSDAIGKALYNEFGPTVFKSYPSHEENRVTNMTATSISSVFVNDSQNLIASYSHQFRKGQVVCMSVFGDDIIATDPSAQYFLLLGIASGRSSPSASSSSTTQGTSQTSSRSSFTRSSVPPTTLSSGSTGFASTTTSKASLSNTSATQAATQSSGIPLASLAMVGGAVIVIVAGVLVFLRRQSGPAP